MCKGKALCPKTVFHRVDIERRDDSGFRNVFWLEKKKSGSEVMCPLSKASATFYY